MEEPGLVDEDEDYAPRRQEYAFNPVQARNELRVGIFYTKKGSHKAAAGRFLEATRWDSNLAEAYWRLGMAWEKLGQPIKAIEAYARFMEIETDSKKSRQVGKRLGRLRGAIRDLPLSAGDSPAEALP